MAEYKNSNAQGADELEKIDLFNLLRDLGHGIRKLGWLVILLAVVFAAQAYFSMTISYTPTYVASSTMAVRVAGYSNSYIEEESAKQMAEIFPYILSSGVLKDVVAADLGVDYISGSIQAEAESGTNLFTISVTDSDAQRAYDTLQSVIENYPKVAEFVFGTTTLEVLDETGVPEDTGKEMVFRGSYKRGALKGATIGIVIMLIYVLSRRTVKSRQQLNKRINLEDFCTIPFIPEKKRKKSKQYANVSLLNERIPQAYLESIRKLRIRIVKEMDQKKYKTLLVTSSIPGEGKTTLAANLAITLAKQGRKVILVDCDARNPSLGKVFKNNDEHPGFAELVKGMCELDEAIETVDVSGGQLQVVFGGKPSEKNTRILGSKEMRSVIKKLSESADIVIFDTPPAALLADTSMLGKFVDAALYVVKYDTARIRQIREGIESLTLSGIDILGYAFNADHESNNRAYGYGYNYTYRTKNSYGNYGSYGKKGRASDGRVVKD